MFSRAVLSRRVATSSFRPASVRAVSTFSARQISFASPQLSFAPAPLTTSSFKVTPTVSVRSFHNVRLSERVPTQQSLNLAKQLATQHCNTPEMHGLIMATFARSNSEDVFFERLLRNEKFPVEFLEDLADVINDSYLSDNRVDPMEYPSTLPDYGTGLTFTEEQVAQHNTRSDCWTIIDNKVYNLSSWVDNHPGGDEIIVSLAGKDSTGFFNDQHGDNDFPKEVLMHFYIGDLNPPRRPRFHNSSIKSSRTVKEQNPF